MAPSPSLHAVILADFATPNGGAAKVALESARGLAEQGVEVAYVHAVGATGSGDGLLDHPGITGIGLDLPDIWARPAAQALVNGVWSREAARRLRPVLDGLPRRPTVLHLHQWTRAFSPSILPLLLRSGHPVALTLHDYFLACPNGVYYRFDTHEPCRLTPLSGACLAAPCDPRSSLHKGVRVLRTLAGRAAVGRTAALDLIHVSDRGYATVAPFAPAGVRHHRLANPVAAERTAPAVIGPGAAIAYVGRLTREKGADLVAEAARAAGLPAVFIGDGPLAAEIRALHPEAELLGWRTAAEVAHLLRSRVRAVAAPSRWLETGPLTIYEALAAGVPAVASNRSGASERVADGETGFVVEPRLADLTRAFEALADDGLANRLGQAAHARYWAAPPTLAAHARGLIAIYEGLLARAALDGRRSGPSNRPALR